MSQDSALETLLILTFIFGFVTNSAVGAILTTVPVVPATEAAPTVYTTVVPTVDAFAADGPDRPPRNVLV